LIESTRPRFGGSPPLTTEPCPAVSASLCMEVMAPEGRRHGESGRSAPRSAATARLSVFQQSGGLAAPAAGLEWALPVALAVAPAHLFAASVCASAVNRGGPGYLSALVLLFFWNAVKFAVMGVLTPSTAKVRQARSGGARAPADPSIQISHPARAPRRASDEVDVACQGRSLAERWWMQRSRPAIERPPSARAVEGAKNRTGLTSRRQRHQA
jgi:hypothetical protein